MDNRSFKTAVEAYLEKTGVSPSSFGEWAMNDRGFVFNMRSGAESRESTRDKVLALMGANPDGIPKQVGAAA